MPNSQSRRASLVENNQTRRLSDLRFLACIDELSECTDAQIKNYFDCVSPLAKEPADLMHNWTPHLYK